MKTKPLQLSILISSIAVIAVGAAMAITNPRREAYQSYAATQMSGYLKEEVCSDAPRVLGDFLQRKCNNLVDMGQESMKDLIAESTQRHNYLLFSIYETDLFLMAGLPRYEFKTVGAFQTFWTYHAEEK